MWSDSITCQVERWRGWKRGMEERQELSAGGRGEYSRVTAMGGRGLLSQVLGWRFIDTVQPDGRQ